MTEFVLQRSTPETLLSHLALYGLGAILEDAGLAVRIRWSDQVEPRPIAETEVSVATIGQVVQRHASRSTAKESWLLRDHPTMRGRGLMSPRLATMDQDAWASFQRGRHEVLDQLAKGRCWLDLRLLACLGEPSYWSFKRNLEPNQDDGANRLEMQPRNQGSEFVGTKLRRLAEAVTGRDVHGVVQGIAGELVEDELGGGRSDSRTATGLAAPGPTDNALAWCAMWGMAYFPIAMRVSAAGTSTPALCSGNLPEARKREPPEPEWFYAPVWTRPWRPARLRTVLASEQLRVATPRTVDQLAPPSSEEMSARSWLSARGVPGVMRFRVAEVGRGRASERRAMLGEPITIHGTE